MVNVYCVKVGTKYDRSFVEKLKSSIEKHFTIEHKFYCLTDKVEKDYDIPVTHPELRGVFHKLTLFQFTGNCLYFDLDIDINDKIDFLASEFDNLTLVNSYGQALISHWKVCTNNSLSDHQIIKFKASLGSASPFATRSSS